MLRVCHRLLSIRGPSQLHFKTLLRNLTQTRRSRSCKSCTYTSFLAIIDTEWNHYRYATAKDEFEIATEETEKKTVYAADDRAAASEELGNLKTAFDEAVKGQNGDEIKRRIGQRIRELHNAVEALEEKAKED